jgi:hypothetical protein
MLASCQLGQDVCSDYEKPERTIIAYLCGDNNLSSEVSVKIAALQQGMQQIGSTNSNLIVYADYYNALPELLQITASSVQRLEQYSEVNSASAEQFSIILQQVMREFPAKSYGLICFSHGSGWLPPGALTSPDGFSGSLSSSGDSYLRSVFEDNGHEMSIGEFAAAIPLTPAGNKFDFIIFEACYMAGVEIAYELRHKARYLLASATEILSDGFVEIYPAQLSSLFSAVPDLEFFAQAYFNKWNNETGGSRSATISVINLEKIENLAKEVRSIYSTHPKADIIGIQHFNRNAYHLFFDLSDYISVSATPEQQQKYDDAINQVVLYHYATPQFMQGYPFSFTIRTHCGLTTYIEQDAFPALNREYEKMAWYQAIKK